MIDSQPTFMLFTGIFASTIMSNLRSVWNHSSNNTQEEAWFFAQLAAARFCSALNLFLEA
jgi:hypothetical protein